MDPSILWLRRDLRLHDLPALASAHRAAGGAPVLALFVVDPTLLASAGTVRLTALANALAAWSASTDGALVIRHGDPAQVVPEVAAQAGARSVHITAETHPWGRRRDQRVQRALQDTVGGAVPLVASGTPYAVDPGSINNKAGKPYRVFTPFSRAWREHGWAAPEPVPFGLRWVRRIESEGLAALRAAATPDAGAAAGVVDDEAAGAEGLTDCSEAAAWNRWEEFCESALANYRTDRDRPDLDGTSHLSMHLKYGTIHPRSLLADLASHHDTADDGPAAFVTELCWREFYADVVHHNPRSLWHDLTDGLAMMDYDDPGSDRVAADRLEAWTRGQTGYPIVDAGMRQLHSQGWMHNRLRMITASFLTKDLHIWWPHGAKVFLGLLADGDVASNNHGWQWVAGTGTDASPYFRVFNPVTQGERFDPDGAYVRRWVPELAHLSGGSAHRPWDSDEAPAEYPAPIVDHGTERDEALARYQTARARR